MTLLKCCFWDARGGVWLGLTVAKGRGFGSGLHVPAHSQAEEASGSSPRGQMGTTRGRDVQFHTPHWCLYRQNGVVGWFPGWDGLCKGPLWLGLGAHTCNPNIWKAEAGVSCISGQLGLHTETISEKKERFHTGVLQSCLRQP